MRVSTAQIFNRGLQRMQAQKNSLSELETKILTGKKMLRPSDDPASSARLLGLERAKSELKQYQDNITMVSQRLEEEEIALRGVTNLLLKVRQLTVQANSATLKDSDRTSIRKEIEQRYDELLGFANQKDSRGDYLFAGSKGGTQPYQTDQFGNFATIAYHGDSSQRHVQISSTRQIADSDAGASVFTQIESDKAVHVTKNSANTGTAEVATPYLKNPDPLEIITLNFGNVATDDTLTLGEVTYQFVTDKNFVSNGNVAVASNHYTHTEYAIKALEKQINKKFSLDATYIKTKTKKVEGEGGLLVLQATKHGTDTIATNGIIAESASNTTAIEAVVSEGGPAIDTYEIEFTGATNYTITNKTTGVTNPTGIANTFSYTNGNKIEIDGMEFAIKGEPKKDDKFTIKPSNHQDSFTTMNRLLAVLEVKNDTDKNKATITAGLGQTLVDLDAMLENLNGTQTSVGGRLNALGSQKLSNGDVIFQLEKTHSEVANIDIVGAISRLEFEKINLQAGQQSFIKLQGLSLFNFL